MSKKYQKLGVEEDPDGSKGLDLSEPVAPLESAVVSLTSNFTVKILLKETNLQLPGLTDLTTIGQLKIEIEKLTNVAVNSQRLIFAGKQLKADEKTLKSFNIVENSSIHLFPIPIRPPEAIGENAAAAPVAVAVPVPSTMNSLSYMIYRHGDNDQSIHLDPVISQHCRDVRLWSVILVFLSSMTLFNYISYALSTGQIGKSPLDSAVCATDTLCSIGGLLVGQYGLNAARTVDMNMIKKYLRWLTVLAVTCIIMRIIWIFDVVIQVKQAVNKAKNDPNYDPTAGDGTGVPKDFPITNFTIQVTIIALVCVVAWLNCVYRAHLLRRSVQIFSDAAAV